MPRLCSRYATAKAYSVGDTNLKLAKPTDFAQFGIDWRNNSAKLFAGSPGPIERLEIGGNPAASIETNQPDQVNPVP